MGGGSAPVFKSLDPEPLHLLVETFPRDAERAGRRGASTRV